MTKNLAQWSEQQLQGVTTDLKELARTRTLADFRSANYPELSSLAAQMGYQPEVVPNDHVRALVEAALSELPRGRYQEAAVELLAFAPGRWETLKSRGRRAALAFGIGYDAFRRRHTDGRPSHFEAVMEEVAMQIAALTDQRDALPPEISSHQPDRVPNVREAAARRYLRPMAATVAIMATAVITFVVVGNGTNSVQAMGPVDVSGYCRDVLGAEIGILDSPDSNVWRCRNPDGTTTDEVDLNDVCRNRVGSSFEAVPTGENGRSWRCAGSVESSAECSVPVGTHDETNQRVNTAIDDLVAAVPAEGCATTPAYLWFDSVVQELALPDGTGAVFKSPSNLVLLQPPEWAAYDRVRGLPPEFVGYPQGPVELKNGAYVLEIDPDHRSAMVARARTGPFFWMPAATYLPWIEAGGISSCLGAPAADANQTQRMQKFENGEMREVVPGSTVEVTIDAPC